MRRLYFTDVHTYPFNEFSKPSEDGRTTLIVEHEQSYEWVAQQIEERKPDLVVNLGDTALTHGYLDALSMTTIVKGYRNVENACRTVGARLVWMTGNHDFENDATRLHVLPFIDDKVLVNKIHIEDGHLFIPFYRDNDVWKKVLIDTAASHASEKASRVYVHLDVVGARMNAGGIICKDGYDSSVVGGLKTFAGHFHHPQVVEHRLGSTYVVGSLMYRNFSDDIVDRPRGIVIDDDDKDPVWVENPHTSQYFSLRVENEGDIANVFKCIHPDRTFLRVTYSPEFEDKVLKLKDAYRGVRFVPLGSEKKSSSFPSAAPSALDPHGVVDEYLRQNPPDILIAEQVSKLGHDLVEQASGGASKTRRAYVQFTSMHIENFLSMQAADVRFDTNEVVYVDGVIEGRDADVSNGAGKSTIFEALLVAYKDAVSPSGVGYDIACGNMAVETNADWRSVTSRIGKIMDDVWNGISFGVGRRNEIERVDHALFDDDRWKLKPAAQLKEMARQQLGTVGSGNHYVDIFLDESETPKVWVGVHFGSRGFGHKVATHGGEDLWWSAELHRRLYG